MWFKNEECEALARETGFIQRSTSRLTGSSFFNLLTVEILDEPTVSYEGLCDILEERHPDVRITPQALCARMNSEGAVEFLKAGLARTLKETARQPLAALEGTAWLAAFPRVLLQDSTQMQIHEKMADDFKGSGGNASTMEFNVFPGQKQRIPISLIIYRLPSEVYRKRQKAAIKAAKRKGRGISLSYLLFSSTRFISPTSRPLCGPWRPSARSTASAGKWS